MTTTTPCSRLEGRTAIITGAGSGIGRAAALLFAQQGARVVLAGRRADKLEEVAAQILTAGGTAAVVAGDVRDERYAITLVDTALSLFGSLDVGFNNAGILGAMEPVDALSLSSFDEVLSTNLTGAFLGAKHQITAMLPRGRGSIIFTSSFVGHTIGLPGMTAYAASKAGLIGMAQCLAAEVGPRGIRVNALLPGGTATPMAGEFSDDPATADSLGRLHALQRIARPAEIAQAALFLASDSASFVTPLRIVARSWSSLTARSARLL